MNQFNESLGVRIAELCQSEQGVSMGDLANDLYGRHTPHELADYFGFSED
jgi:hypothetical protein